MFRELAKHSWEAAEMFWELAKHFWEIAEMFWENAEMFWDNAKPFRANAKLLRETNGNHMSAIFAELPLALASGWHIKRTWGFSPTKHARLKAGNPLFEPFH